VTQDPVFSAQVSFLGSDRREQSLVVEYSAKGPNDAIDSAWRFARGRIMALPEMFREISCIKVSAYSIGRIGPDGDLLTRTSCFPLHEWKHDWGVPPHDNPAKRENG